MRWPRRCLSVLLLIPAAVAIGCGGSNSSEGRVLAEGKNLGEFKLRGFDTVDRGPYRYVITKVEVFDAGRFSDFPPGCGGRSCTSISGEWPVVLLYLRAPACESAGARPSCVPTALDRQCLGSQLPLLRPNLLKDWTYIWWERDTAGRPNPHVCLHYAWVLGSHSTGRDTVMAFIPHVNTPPTRFRLVVEGRDVPIRLTPARSASAPTSSGPPPAPSTSPEPVAAELCKQPGIRYAGATAEGTEVCFTLTSDRSKWVEIGFRFDRASGCLGTGEKYYAGPIPLASPGQINERDFAATIRGARASGVLKESVVCKGKTFQWTAHRLP